MGHFARVFTVKVGLELNFPIKILKIRILRFLSFREVVNVNVNISVLGYHNIHGV